MKSTYKLLGAASFGAILAVSLATSPAARADVGEKPAQCGTGLHCGGASLKGAKACSQGRDVTYCCPPGQRIGGGGTYCSSAPLEHPYCGSGLSCGSLGAKGTSVACTNPNTGLILHCCRPGERRVPDGNGEICAKAEAAQSGAGAKAKPGSCKADKDCAAGQQCASGSCATPPPQSTPPKTQPAPKPPAPKCDADADCGKNERCKQGACVPKKKDEPRK